MPDQSLFRCGRAPFPLTYGTLLSDGQLHRSVVVWLECRRVSTLFRTIAMGNRRHTVLRVLAMSAATFALVLLIGFAGCAFVIAIQDQQVRQQQQQQRGPDFEKK